MSKQSTHTETAWKESLHRFYRHTRKITRYLFTSGMDAENSQLAHFVVNAFAADRCVVFSAAPYKTQLFALRAVYYKDGSREDSMATQPHIERLTVEQAQRDWVSKQGNLPICSPGIRLRNDLPLNPLLTHGEFGSSGSLHVLHIPLIDRKSEQIGFIQVARKEPFDEVDLILGQLLAFQIVVCTKTIDATKEIVALPVDISDDSILNHLCVHCRAVLRCKAVWLLHKDNNDVKVFAASVGDRNGCPVEVKTVAVETFRTEKATAVSGIHHGPIAQLVIGEDGIRSVLVAEPALMPGVKTDGDNYGFDAFDLELLNVISKQFSETQRSLQYRREMDEIFHQLLESPKDSTLYSFLSKVVRLYFDDQAKCILYWADQRSKQLVARQYYFGAFPHGKEHTQPFYFSLDDRAFATYIFNRHDCPSGLHVCTKAIEAPCISSKGRERFGIGDDDRIIGIRLEFANRPVGVLVAWGDGVPDNAASQPLRHLSMVAGASIAFYAREGARTAVLEECSRLLNNLQSGADNEWIHNHIVEAATRAGFDRARLFTLVNGGSAFKLVSSKPTVHGPVVISFEENEYARDTYLKAKSSPHPVIYTGKEFGTDPHCELLNKKPHLPWAVAPLVTAGRVLGQLVVDNASSELPIDEELDLKALGLLASMGAIAIADEDRKSELGEFETEEQQVRYWILRSLFLSDLEPNVVLLYDLDSDQNKARLYGSLVSQSTSISPDFEAPRSGGKPPSADSGFIRSRGEIVDELRRVDAVSATQLRSILEKNSLRSALEAVGKTSSHLGVTDARSLANECGDVGESRVHTRDDLSFFGRLAKEFGLAAVLAVKMNGINTNNGCVLAVGRVDNGTSDDPIIADEIFTRNDQLHISAFAERAAVFLAELGLSRLSVKDRSKRVQQEFDLTPFRFLRRHISRTAYSKISNEDSALRAAFDRSLREKNQNAFVMSVDIRKSTDLMLQAVTPTAFAEFITGLVDNIRSVIFDHHGVFDKFTGDGVLCFFPEFFSDRDAGIRALVTALECHRIFKKRHDESLHSFHNPQWNAGLGIGIGYGEVELIQEWERLTVVGRPVVYACRYSACPADKTYLTQQAYSRISAKYGAYIEFDTVPLDIKNENTVKAYDVRLRDGFRRPLHAPWWLQDDIVHS